MQNSLSKRVKIFLFIQSVLAVVLVVSSSLAVWQFANEELISMLFAGGVSMAVFSLFVIFFLQGKITKNVSSLVSQVDFQNRDEFDSLYERSPVAYLVIDTSGKILNVNPAATNLLQGEIDSMQNFNMYKFIVPNDELNESVLKGKIEAGLTLNDEEIPFKTIKGEEIWVMLSVFSHRIKNHRLVALVDITSQKAIDNAKSEFVALATHQLRTPIAAIRWNVELLDNSMKETKTEKQDKYIIKIERNVHRMLNLINDFLSVSKLEMGTFAASEEVVNLTEYLDSILVEFEEKIVQKKLVLERDENPQQTKIKTDSRLFHIILSNLLSNAVKYIHNEGTINISYEATGGSLKFVITDTGIGIPEDELDKLFTKFYRATNAQSHQTEGTGLGLYVVRQSIEKLGGTITVDSKENEGARFEIKLPSVVVS